MEERKIVADGAKQNAELTPEKLEQTAGGGGTRRLYCASCRKHAAPAEFGKPCPNCGKTNWIWRG